MASAYSFFSLERNVDRQIISSPVLISAAIGLFDLISADVSLSPVPRGVCATHSAPCFNRIPLSHNCCLLLSTVFIYRLVALARPPTIPGRHWIWSIQLFNYLASRYSKDSLVDLLGCTDCKHFRMWRLWPWRQKCHFPRPIMHASQMRAISLFCFPICLHFYQVLSVWQYCH